MPDKTPTDLILERVNRLSESVASMMEGQSLQNRALLRVMEGLREDIAALQVETTGLRREVRLMGSELVLLSNRVEGAVSRALRVDIRLDEAEDRH